MGYGKLAKGISEEEVKRKLERVMPSQEMKKEFKGSSPSVFIGSHSYPKVNTGILSPQHPGDSSLMDSPDIWYNENYSIEKIASLRTSLVNSKKKLNVKNDQNFLSPTREISMARKPVDIEVSLSKKPGSNIKGGKVKPVSASGNVENFEMTENPSVDKSIEKLYYDKDAKAETAIKELSEKGIDNYKIQQSLTTGLLGLKENRKLVPTRWSITASDDIISKKIREDVRDFQQINQIEYYTNSYNGNNFHIFLIPGKWEYELIELKRSGSVWNSAKNTYIAQNHEGFSGRTSYAEETSGAFYAARLGVLEHLRNRKRQAKTLILREVTPKYWAPLGVWIIRETVRNSFKNFEENDDKNKSVLSEFQDVKWVINENFRFLFGRINNRSVILQGRQSTIEDYF